jgi:AcrR family transcriptional regulator
MKPGIRDTKKQITHTNLLESALELMGEEKGLGDLSLREVTAKAGIVPAAFYRHFKSMEELGLLLVEECGNRIQMIVGDARTKGAYRSALQRTALVFGSLPENGQGETVKFGKRSERRWEGLQVNWPRTCGCQSP